MRALVLAALVLAGCPHPVPPPVPVPTTTTTIPSCPPTEPTSAGVCDGLFTEDGLACVRCPNVGGCVDIATEVYCAQGACLDDARCQLDVTVPADGGANIPSSHRRRGR